LPPQVQHRSVLDNPARALGVETIMTPALVGLFVATAALPDDAVRFEGNHALEAAELATVVGSDPGDGAVLRVLALYYDHGFVEAQVNVTRERGTDGAITAVFHIEEGPVYRLGRVQITGDVRGLAPALPRAGTIFERSAIVRALEVLRTRYRAVGPEPLVTPFSSVDRERHVVELRIGVELPSR
jgi:outer membrane protein assembly factor BamA